MDAANFQVANDRIVILCASASDSHQQSKDRDFGNACHLVQRELTDTPSTRAAITLVCLSVLRLFIAPVLFIAKL